MPFTLPDKVYAVIKWLLVIVLPAFGTFYSLVSDELGLDHTESVLRILMAFGVFLGVILGISAVSYNNSDAKYDGTIDPYYANAVTHPSALDIPALADRWADEEGGYPDLGKKELLLKVDPMHNKRVEEH